MRIEWTGMNFSGNSKSYNDTHLIPSDFMKQWKDVKEWMEAVSKIPMLKEGIDNGGEFYFRVLDDE